MVVVDRSVLAPYASGEMFALVDDVESYPQFLPWCEGTRVDLREPGRTVATIRANFHGLRQQFTTQNTNRPAERIDIALVSGPFRTLRGHWVFTPLGDRGCRIDFRLEYQFASRILEKAAGPVFHRIADSFVDAFVRRAEERFGAGR
jgi:ribosome-associated toxin RatA of RatAB toxin-antitoxin module